MSGHGGRTNHVNISESLEVVDVLNTSECLGMVDVNI